MSEAPKRISFPDPAIRGLVEYVRKDIVDILLAASKAARSYMVVKRMCLCTLDTTCRECQTREVLDGAIAVYEEAIQ